MNIIVRTALIAAGLCAASQSPVSAQSTCTSQHVTDWFPGGFNAQSAWFSTTVTTSASGGVTATSSPRFVIQGLFAGAVWIREGQAVGGSVETQLLPPQAENDLAFGQGLALNAEGNLLVVGAPGWAPVASRMFVYRKLGGSWILEKQINGQAADWSGRYLALDASGETLVSTAPFRWVPPPQGGLAAWRQGAVDTYRRSGGAWVLESSLSGHDLPLLVDNFGNAIALSGDGQRLAFRSMSWPADVVQSGAVYVLARVGTGWVFEARLQEPVQSSGAGFGNSLAFDANGTVLIAGSPFDSRTGVTQAGSLTVFRRGAAGWSYDVSFTPSQPFPNGKYGTSCDLSADGKRAIVAAPVGADSGLEAGSVEEIALAPGTWTRLSVRTSPSPEYAAFFGLAVAMNSSGSKFVVGEPSADFYGVDFGRVHFFEAPCLNPTVYCTAQTNTLGCAAQIAGQGTPSVSSLSGFVISASNVRNQQNGMLIYSTNGRAQIAWQGGTLCVGLPLRRTPLVSSGGSAATALDCSGVLLRDFNTWAIGANDPALFAGQQVQAQFYSRDPGSSANINLSNALEFTLEP